MLYALAQQRQNRIATNPKQGCIFRPEGKLPYHYQHEVFIMGNRLTHRTLPSGKTPIGLNHHVNLDDNIFARYRTKDRKSYTYIQILWNLKLWLAQIIYKHSVFTSYKKIH